MKTSKKKGKNGNATRRRSRMSREEKMLWLASELVMAHRKLDLYVEEGLNKGFSPTEKRRMMSLLKKVEKIQNRFIELKDKHPETRV